MSDLRDLRDPVSCIQIYPRDESVAQHRAAPPSRPSYPLHLHAWRSVPRSPPVHRAPSTTRQSYVQLPNTGRSSISTTMLARVYRFSTADQRRRIDPTSGSLTLSTRRLCDMPADFIDQLQSALHEITCAADARDHYRTRQVAATASLKASAKSARGIVGLLDALLTAALKNDPALLADWAASKRIPEAALEILENTMT